MTAVALPQVSPLGTPCQGDVSAFVSRYQSANTRECTSHWLTTTFLNSGKTLRNVRGDDRTGATTA